MRRLTRRVTQAKKSSRRLAPLTEGIRDGRVVAVEKRSATVEFADGTRHAAQLPQHINETWLRAAVALAPLDAAVAVSREGRVMLWSVFPGDAHAAGAALDVELTGRRIKVRAAESFELRCSNGSLTIDQEGNVVVRGADVVSRASGANRVRGAVIRFN